MSEKGVNLSCELIDNINSYYLIGMDKYFNNYKLKELDTNTYSFNKEEYKGYDNFKLAYVKDNKIYKIDKEYKNTQGSYKKSLKLFFIDSYDGISIQINNKIPYDKYLLYEIIDNKRVFILETKDVLILSNELHENHIYYVEAYIEYDNYYLLSNTSDYTKCKFKEIVIDNNLLTICIPVYNGETFIPRTLDSVILSSYDKYNILIVNDGSTDNTRSVLDWYSNKYDFVHVINNDNHGVSYTRNVLLDNVGTEYIAFLDADDIVSPNMYKLLMDTIIDTKADVSICKTIVRDDINTNSLVLDVKCDKYKTYSYEDMVKEAKACSKDNIYFVALWNKVVRTDIAKKVKFPEGKYYEDSAYTAALYTYVDKFVFVAAAIYYWDKRKRLTEGTFSSAYDEVEIEKTIEYYVDATIYPIDNCNKDNQEFVIYDSLKNLIDYFATMKNKESKIYKYMESKIIEVSKRIDINNKYLKEDKDLNFKVVCFKYM